MIGEYLTVEAKKEPRFDVGMRGSRLRHLCRGSRSSTKKDSRVDVETCNSSLIAPKQLLFIFLLLSPHDL